MADVGVGADYFTKYYVQLYKDRFLSKADLSPHEIIEFQTSMAGTLIVMMRNVTVTAINIAETRADITFTDMDDNTSHTTFSTRSAAMTIGTDTVRGRSARDAAPTPTAATRASYDLRAAHVARTLRSQGLHKHRGPILPRGTPRGGGGGRSWCAATATEEEEARTQAARVSALR